MGAFNSAARIFGKVVQILSWNYVSRSVAIHIIVLYSSKLEPVTNKLLEVQLDLQYLNKDIGKILKIFSCHRETTEEEFALTFKKLNIFAIYSTLNLYCHV